MNSVLQRNFACDSQEKDVIILRSHSLQKFSVHLIFTKAVFLNNKICKIFIKAEIMENRPEFRNFVDMKVYNQNQNFRLFHSSKAGKINPLIVSSNCKFSLGKPSGEIFFQALIGNVEDGVRIIHGQQYVPPGFHPASVRGVASGQSQICRGPITPTSGSPYWPEMETFLETLLKPPAYLARYRVKDHTIEFDVSNIKYSI